VLVVCGAVEWRSCDAIVDEFEPNIFDDNNPEMSVLIEVSSVLCVCPGAYLRKYLGIPFYLNTWLYR
jgi:hypothetical protein